MKFQIGHKSSVLVDFRVSQRGNIIIGNNSVINNSVRFDNRFPIIIGDNVSISYGVQLITKGHELNSPEFKTKGAGINIGDYVWLCTNAVILPGVSIQRGGVALTSALVTKNIGEFVVVGGNPAIPISIRNNNLIYRLDWNPWVPFWG